MCTYAFHGRSCRKRLQLNRGAYSPTCARSKYSFVALFESLRQQTKSRRLLSMRDGDAINPRRRERSAEISPEIPRP